jgi:4-hydroxybenzoyl-CoA reductase subunit beta
MLRLPQFGVATPDTVAAAIEELADSEARLVAGGSDLLPNLKHRLEHPPKLVSLNRIAELRGIRQEGDVLVIGAGMTLTEVSEHADVRKHFPSLAEAAGLVASPLIRNMGTIGGNVNLDVRCRYVNQTEFWREAIGGGCLKSEGDVCHVVPGGRNCVAAMSSDCAPVLISLGADVVQVASRGERVVPVVEFYRSDGINHITKEPGELTKEIRIPLPTGPRRSAYAKWTVRKSIDFPLVSVALRFDLEEDSVDAPVTAVKIVAGVLNPKPRVLSKLDEVVGRKLSDPAVARIVSERAHKQCKPLENVPYEAPYRRQMIKVHTRRAIERIVATG